MIIATLKIKIKQSLTETYQEILQTVGKLFLGFPTPLFVEIRQSNDKCNDDSLPE